MLRAEEASAFRELLEANGKFAEMWRLQLEQGEAAAELESGEQAA